MYKMHGQAVKGGEAASIEELHDQISHISVTFRTSMVAGGRVPQSTEVALPST
jgi:hypothetical protein